MKKKYIVAIISALLIILFAVVYWAIYTSFTVVKPTAQQINDDLTSKVFSRIVRIPTGIPRPSYDINQTVYLWEMETTAGEITGVQFSYTPSFGKDEEILTAVLEMPANSDPSIFTKVLPAVIANDQSLKAATEKKANTNGNKEALYQSIALVKDLKNDQTIKITWKYNKNDLPRKIITLYEKLDYPPPILKTFYQIPNFIINLARG